MGPVIRHPVGNLVQFMGNIVPQMLSFHWSVASKWVTTACRLHVHTPDGDMVIYSTQDPQEVIVYLYPPGIFIYDPKSASLLSWTVFNLCVYDIDISPCPVEFNITRKWIYLEGKMNRPISYIWTRQIMRIT